MLLEDSGYQASPGHVGSQATDGRDESILKRVIDGVTMYSNVVRLRGLDAIKLWKSKLRLTLKARAHRMNDQGRLAFLLPASMSFALPNALSGAVCM